MEVRRVNFYGGPNIGKTTLVCDLFSRLNRAGVSCGRAEESVKPWAYEGRSPTGFDQVYLFGRQIRNEDVILRNSKEPVLCEAPLLLCTYYARRMGMPGWKHLRDMAFEFESSYPALHLVLERGDWEYKAAGRYETERQALQVDMEVRSFLNECDWSFLGNLDASGGSSLRIMEVSPSDPAAVAELIARSVDAVRATDSG